MCGEAACGAGTYWDAVAGMCRSTLLLCPGDVDGDGTVNVTDVLDVLGGFGANCGPGNNAPGSCASAPCCNADACGTGTYWDAGMSQCVTHLNQCPGDVDFDGVVGVNDVLNALSGFGVACQ